MAPRSGKGEPIPRDVQVSKKLSWLLRHGAEKEGLKLDANGYINLADVLANRNLRSLKVTFDDVQEIVQDNDKQRFALLLDPAKPDIKATSTRPGDWLFRANQGHSIKMESDSGLLQTIDKDNMPEIAVHGTTRAKWMMIVASGGLKPMSRNHVHFAAGLPAGFSRAAMGDGAVTTAEAPVISGMRSSSRILMYLDISKALDAGLSLGLSANGVILTAGDANGLVPLNLFRSVEDHSGLGLLLEDGQIVREAPDSWNKKGKPLG